VKKKTFDVEGLSDEQVDLARQFIELMKQTSQKENAFESLKRLLQKGVDVSEAISEEEANRIAAEAVTWARGK
jgi:hypothetical protein